MPVKCCLIDLSRVSSSMPLIIYPSIMIIRILSPRPMELLYGEKYNIWIYRWMDFIEKVRIKGMCILEDWIINLLNLFFDFYRCISERDARWWKPVLVTRARYTQNLQYSRDGNQTPCIFSILCLLEDLQITRNGLCYFPRMPMFFIRQAPPWCCGVW